MQDHIQAIVTVLSLINPAVCASIFSQSGSGRTRHERMVDASKASFAVFVILIVSALIGTKILKVFGLSIDSFMVAGGVVLAWMGFLMLSGKGVAPVQASDPSSSFSSHTPLIFFAASPATITGVITVAAAQSADAIPETALVAVGVGALVLWGILLVTVRLGRSSGGSGFLSQTISRFMGLIVLAMGVQFGLQGLQSFLEAAR